MRLIALAFVSAIIFISYEVPLAAQTPRVKAAIANIPAEGTTTQSFVPGGWVIYSEAKGDLNGDAVDDAAITLSLNDQEAEKLKAKEGDDFEWPPYIVVVLFGKQDGGYTRFATNGRLYPANTGDGPLSLKISKGVLATNQNYRDGWAVDATFRFRYDAAANKLMLIGFDLENYSRSSIYEGHKASENYLTGVRIDYAKSDGPRKQSSAYGVLRRAAISYRSIPFEETRFNDDDEDLFNIKPFGISPKLAASTKTGISGSWEWRGRPNNKKEQTYFAVDIKQKGIKVTGDLWFGMLVDGENDGADSSRIPFIGMSDGDAVEIEFDPKDFHSIEEETVRYTKPKVTSTATLRLKDGNLEWTQTKGVLDDLKLGVPNSFSLTRVK